MIVPSSIFSEETVGFDKTWHDRLNGLDIDSLLINIESEKDTIKLEYWLEMLGIDSSIFDFSILNEHQRRILINSWLDILVHSGSEYSVKKMALALGASHCDIFYGDALIYDGSAKYNGLHYYDAGDSHHRFSIHVSISGISALERPDYEMKFRKLMRAVQPIRIYLKLINFI